MDPFGRRCDVKGCPNAATEWASIVPDQPPVQRCLIHRIQPQEVAEILTQALLDGKMSSASLPPSAVGES